MDMLHIQPLMLLLLSMVMVLQHTHSILHAILHALPEICHSQSMHPPRSPYPYTNPSDSVSIWAVVLPSHTHCLPVVPSLMLLFSHPFGMPTLTRAPGNLCMLIIITLCVLAIVLVT